MIVELVAIARNERRFIEEWLAHYLSLGFDKIVIYDDGSSDGTDVAIERVSRQFPVELRRVVRNDDLSPQITSYNHALENTKRSYRKWIAFFDIDEFLVPTEKSFDLHHFLRSQKDHVGAIGVNWLTFGSGGRVSNDYGLVRNAFRTGGMRDWGNNRHIKTIVRSTCALSMGIHDCRLSGGRYVYPDGTDLLMPRKRGISDRVDHSVIQLNHYQCKSQADFNEKIQRGRAGKKLSDPSRIRKDPEAFFAKLDRNECYYDQIDQVSERFAPVYEAVLRLTGSC